MHVSLEGQGSPTGSCSCESVPWVSKGIQDCSGEGQHWVWMYPQETSAESGAGKGTVSHQEGSQGLMLLRETQYSYGGHSVTSRNGVERASLLWVIEAGHGHFLCPSHRMGQRYQLL